MKGRPAGRWDAFICHATEDKDAVARPLALSLTKHGLQVWYDEFSLRIGDSLRRSIERGLSRSRFGIVVLSPNFFLKEWPQRELDALVGKEVRVKRKIIIPIWHNIDAKGVARYSPTLADKVSLSTAEGVEKVVVRILQEVDPKNTEASLIQGARVDDDLVDPDFRKAMAERLDVLTQLLQQEGDSSKVETVIDNIIMLFTAQIDRWDVASVKLATREVFSRLYSFSGEEGQLANLYLVFKDLFSLAHRERSKLIGSMMEVFNLILFECWVKDYDIERGEAAARIMLKLGMDFLTKDLEIVRGCAIAIDNLAGDMFEPEIFSKEVLLAAVVWASSSENAAAKDFADELLGWIIINEANSKDDGKLTYLRDSVAYAETEAEDLRINIVDFKSEFLVPIIESTVETNIQGFVDSLLDELKERGDHSFAIEELSQLILSYESERPTIAQDLTKRVHKLGNKEVEQLFNELTRSNSFLRKFYGESDMITSFSELMEFLEANADIEKIGVGVTTNGICVVTFVHNLNQKEKASLRILADKYEVRQNLELDANQMIFEMDDLVYAGGKSSMKKLSPFLKDINATVAIDELSTGIEFKLRKLLAE